MSVTSGGDGSSGATQQRRLEKPIGQIVDSYRRPSIRLYSTLRFAILRQVFLDEIGQYLPTNGKILDIGCGFGLFSLYFAALEPSRELTGIDSNGRRIEHARESATRLGLENVEYREGDALELASGQHFDAIYMLDLVHHLPSSEVRPFLASVRDLLRPGGTLLIKDVEDRPRWKMVFTLLLDRLMVGREPIHYWAEPDLSALLREVGFQVRHHRMRDYLPYPHILYVCRDERES